MLFKLGDGTYKNEVINSKLNIGDHYTTFLRAYVRQVESKFLIARKGCFLLLSLAELDSVKASYYSTFEHSNVIVVYYISHLC